MTGSLNIPNEKRTFVPLSNKCFQRIGKPLPRDVRLEQVLASVPKGAFEKDSGAAAKQLLITVGLLSLAVLGLNYLPWFLMPVAWALAGLAGSGLFVIENDCENKSWVDHPVVNEVVAILSSVPLLHTFSFVEVDSEEAQDTNTHRLFNNMLVLASFGAGTFALYYFTGLWGLIKYWALPFVAYKAWMFVCNRLRNSTPSAHAKPQGEDEHLPPMRTLFPRWLEIISSHINVYTPAMATLAVPSYRWHEAYAALQSKWSPYVSEVQLTWSTLVEALKMSEVVSDMSAQEALDLKMRQEKGFFRFWMDRVNWLHVVILFGTPAFGLYGAYSTELCTKTAIFAVVWYFFTGWGITAGYHRLWSHKSYSVSAPVEFILMLAGTGAVQGSAKWWCRNHRAHHRFTDTEKDPYNARQGFFYSHFGWMMIKPNAVNYGQADVTDLKHNWILNFQHKYYLPLLVLVSFVAPTLIAGLGWGDFRGGYFYAGVIRLIFVHHSTFCVNSVAHYFGDQTYDDTRTPKDHIFTALLTLGEGYHAFHHSFAHDYRNGIRWYDYDPTKWLINTLAFFGLAYDLKTTSTNVIQIGKLSMAQKKLDKAKAKVTWPTKPEDLPVISWMQFKERCSNGEELVVVDGVAHDVSDFIDDHPGGDRLVRSAVGTDCSKNFNGAVYNHSNPARDLLATFRVARVEGPVADAARPKAE